MPDGVEIESPEAPASGASSNSTPPARRWTGVCSRSRPVNTGSGAWSTAVVLIDRRASTAYT